MKRCARHGIRWRLVALLAAFAGPAVAAPTQTTLVNFAGGADPAYPNGRLLLGASGVLYGISRAGGAGGGTVFALLPPVAGQSAWSVQVIYSFPTGSNPGGGLISDANGVLYGVTEEGGAQRFGTVFSLTPPAGGAGAWTPATLYSFLGGSDGEYPSVDAGLATDAAGKLYGTTINGGLGNGIAFRLTPPAAGKTVWTETILHSFAGGDDGYFPEGGLLAGGNGAFYGTTSGGGKTISCNGNACGTLFSLTPPAAGSGKWSHRVLHSFLIDEGADPTSTLIEDAAANLYGVALQGGGGAACSSGCGTVFRVPVSHPRPTVLHAFASGADSEFPQSVLVLDAAGALWGATAGATPNRLGATFVLRPPAGAGKKWTETVIHTFTGPPSDGSGPTAGLTPGLHGVFYGVTGEGGSGSRGVCGDGCGTVFEITP